MPVRLNTDKTDPVLMEMSGEEESHERLMRQISSGKKGGMEGGSIAQLEGRHKASGGNALRAAGIGC